MRFAESHDDACRYCGSTQIVIFPPSSAGQCAGCSEEVRAYEARLDRLAERKLAVARAAFASAEAERRVAEQLRHRAERRAVLVEAGRARLRRIQAALLKALPSRTRTAHNY